jgi:hypothetical protein
MMPGDTAEREPTTSGGGILIEVPAREPVPAAAQFPAARESSAVVAPEAPPTDVGALVRRIATQAVPYLSNRLQYLGRTGVAGIAFLVFATVCFISANSPLRQELATQRLDLLEAQQDATARHRTGQDAAPARQLQTFVKRLPARAELPVIMTQIVKQANDAGITLERGSYDFSVARSGKIVRARLSFPVTGSYPNVRKFIDGTLAAVPGAAVDGLKISRGHVGDEAVNADLSFAVFLRNEP